MSRALRRVATFAVILVLVSVATRAHANPPVVLRLASIAPDRTAWAQALRNFARDVESQSNGQVRIKWYLGGVAGDDVEAGERIKSGQLDGIASAGRFCSRLSPTLRALRILATEREQSVYATNRMKADIDDEFQRAGFVNLGVTAIGPDMLFTKTPVRDLADLRHGRYWVWDLDRDLGVELREMGINVVPLPLDKAAHGYDANELDGFIAAPTAALAFQWSTQARYLSDARLGFINGCLTIANRAFDSLPLDTRRLLAASAARLRQEFESVGRGQDQALLDGLFAHQGMKALTTTAAAKRELATAAQAARERLGDKLLPAPLLAKVRAVLDEQGHASTR